MKKIIETWAIVTIFASLTLAFYFGVALKSDLGYWIGALLGDIIGTITTIGLILMEKMMNNDT